MPNSCAGPGWSKRRGSCTASRRGASAPFPKFVIRRSTLCHELRKQRGTSKNRILVPLFDLKFLIELAATGVGTSNRKAALASIAALQQGAFAAGPFYVPQETHQPTPE